MSGTLKVLTSAPDALLVPYKAITEQLGEFYVYVADSSKVSQQKVALGRQIDKSIISPERVKRRGDYCNGGGTEFKGRICHYDTHAHRKEIDKQHIHNIETAK